MNLFCCTGNLGNNCEIRRTKNNTAVASFSMAVKSSYGDREKILWLRCQIWGKRAEGNLIQYLNKGTQVAVSGELSESEWVGKDGDKMKSLELNVQGIDLIGGKRQPPGSEYDLPF